MKAFLVTILAALICPAVFAQLPDVISYQGYLRVGEEPINDPNAHLVFRVYSVSDQGQPLWVEEHLDVQVADGVFSVLLGSVNHAPFVDLPFGDPLWIGVAMGLGEEMTPRTPLVAAPYSLQARSLRLPFTGIAETTGDDAAITFHNVGNADGIDVIVGDPGTQGWDPNNATADGVNVGFSPGNGVATGYTGLNGIDVEYAVQNGINVRQSAQHGVLVQSAGAAGLRVDDATTNGVYVGSAGHNGLFVGAAGTPSSSVGHSGNDGLEIQGAQHDGVFVGYAGGIGVNIQSVGFQGIHIGGAFNAIDVDATTNDGIVLDRVGDVTSSGGDPHRNNAIEIGGVEDSGIYVGEAGRNGAHFEYIGEDGVFVRRAGPSAAYGNVSSLSNGFEVAAAQGYGLYVGHSGAAGVRVERAVNNGVYVDSTGNGIHVNEAGDDGFRVTNAGGNGLTISHADNDGVYVASAGAWAGYFNGNVRVTGTFDNTSDRRLKDAIRPTQYGLREILDLVPVDFTWKDRPEYGTRIGLVAQDVEAVIPNVVSPPDGKSEYYGVSYSELIPVLIRAIQEQQAQIEMLKDEVAKISVTAASR